MENEYEDIISNSNIVEDSEEEKRFIDAIRKGMPSYKNNHKPLSVTSKGLIILKAIWYVLKIILLFLTILFLVPFAININVTLVNALSCTVALYILKLWWKGK